MAIYKYLVSLKGRIFFCISIFILGCIDPAETEYNIIDNLIYIDANVSTEEGTSSVLITRSVGRDGTNVISFVEGAAVSFINTITNEEVILNQSDKIYLPPADFVAAVGETWELSVTLPNGKKYISTPETIIETVPVTDIRATYNSELVYDKVLNEYVPGHTILIDFDDPPNEENYYYWNFKSYEKLKICETCIQGVFRNGICLTDNNAIEYYYYNYDCESSCWHIRYNDDIIIFSDEFSDGLSTVNLPVAEVLLHTNKNILVEIQQFSISATAYQYYKVLKDIVNNNGNLNAPPPAAFFGNIVNENDANDYVLGRFTAAAAATFPIFIERESITDKTIEGNPPPARYEDCEVDQNCVTIAPCADGRRDRTSVEPNGWIEL